MDGRNLGGLEENREEENDVILFQLKDCTYKISYLDLDDCLSYFPSPVYSYISPKTIYNNPGSRTMAGLTNEGLIIIY